MTAVNPPGRTNRFGAEPRSREDSGKELRKINKWNKSVNIAVTDLPFSSGWWRYFEERGGTKKIKMRRAGITS